MRIGHGYDVHRLKPGRSLVLGGVTIPWDLGLDGHSDADVLTHAVMDALLGAAGLWDIGHAFPDTDDAYLNISSLILLKRVMEMLSECGLRVGNVDATIVAQQPRLAAYIPSMRAALSEAMGVDEGRVNVKATTEERLGFTGSGEGMAAHAVALLEEQD